MMIDFLFKPVYGDVAIFLGYLYLLCFFVSAGLVSIRSAQVGEFCKGRIDEVDFLLSKEPLAKSFWRALMAYFGVICVSGWL